MKFLIDTNILIPVEPASLADIGPSTPVVAEFLRLAQESRQQLYLHPLVVSDLERDKNATRLEARKALLPKYNPLPDPPPIPLELERALGTVGRNSNDWVDHHLLAALHANSVNYLVTEDQGIHRKAARLGLGTRVVLVEEAIALLRDLFDRVPPSPPAIITLLAHSLDATDPIFESFRQDYPRFDVWLTQCKQEHRKAWVARIGDGTGYAGICIVNKEEKEKFGLQGKVLKICSFKVSGSFQGHRLGELLLKTVLHYAKSNDYDGLFVTVLGKYSPLVRFFQDFGFEESAERTSMGELVLRKGLRWTKEDKEQLDPLEFNLKYGPFEVKIASAPAFVVPIQPRYHRLLFPDAEAQGEFFPGLNPFGNAIRKAYLCHSSIGEIPEGSNVFFYRSKDVKGLTAVGIVEGTLRSETTDAIAAYVGTRTVYSYAEIKGMCCQPVLAILFRQVHLIQPSIALEELKRNGFLSAAPQSIASCSENGKKWISQKLGM